MFGGISIWRRTRGSVLRGGRLLGAACLLGLLALRVWDPGPVEVARLRVFDFYQRLSPRAAIDHAVTVVDIDEKSLAVYGQWPWPRTRLANLIDRLTAARAVVIGMDVVFPEPDRTSPNILAKILPGLDRDVAKILGAMPSNDEIFAESLKGSRVVLGQSAIAIAYDDTLRHPKRVTPNAQIGGDPRDFLLEFAGTVQNLEALDPHASGRGIFSLAPEIDGIVRRVPSLVRVGEDILPALFVEMLRVATGQTTYAVRVNKAGIAGIVVDGLRIPTDRSGKIWVRYAPLDWSRYVSASEVINGTADPELLAGKLALVGSSATGIGDIRATPLGDFMPGVEVHAQLIETVLAQSYLSRPNFALGSELFAIFLAGVLLLIFVPITGARWTMPLVIMIVLIITGSSWYSFDHDSLLLDASYPVVSTILLYTVLAYGGYYSEEQGKKHIRQAFGRYLSPVVVERLAKNPKELELGGEQRVMSIIFTDIRGFTTISERFKDDPKGLTNLINKFLTPMTDVVLAWSGTIDKYIGDCLMAFWNAPLDDDQHAANACHAALEMFKALDRVNESLAADASRAYPTARDDPSGVSAEKYPTKALDIPAGDAEHGNVYPIQKIAAARNLRALQPAKSDQTIRLKIGVGISTGECLVGNLGSVHRFDYSVLGDPVNFASRLEGQTKNYGVGILISEATRLLAPEFAALELDLIVVKGKREAIRIYGLIGDSELAETEGFRTLERLHGQMLAAYRGQRWHEARELLAECIDQDESLEGLYQLYSARIDHYLTDSPGPDWDGVFLARSK